MEQAPIINLKEVDSEISLRGINLTVTAGETLAIVGRADSGKSALLRCIALLERPSTGIVAIDQKNLTFLASRELCNERRMIGLISTKAEFLNSQTLAKNVALPLKIQGAPKARVSKLVEQALAQAGLEFKENNFPENLSPLQKIQLDIARNLVNNIKILLCDDIFVGLDQKSIESLVALLKKLQQDLKLTLIITTNDAEIIKNMCQKVIVMQHGTIIEKCSVFELFTRPSSDTAKDFLRFTTKHELPWCLRRKIVTQETADHHAIVRMNFSECLAPEEILNNTLEAYDLKMNIIQAYQESITGRTINIMLLEIFGIDEIVSDALTFLNNNGLQCEIIGYVPNNH